MIQCLSTKTQQTEILGGEKKEFKIIDDLKQFNKGCTEFNSSCSGVFIAGTSKWNVLFMQTVILGKSYDHVSSGLEDHNGWFWPDNL